MHTVRQHLQAWVRVALAALVSLSLLPTLDPYPQRTYSAELKVHL